MLLSDEQRSSLKVKAEISGLALVPFSLVIGILMVITYMKLRQQGVVSITDSRMRDVVLWLSMLVLYFGASLGMMYIPKLY